MKTTQSKFAELMGISKQRVSQWVETGIISLDENGKVDPDLAKKQLMGNLDLSRREDWESNFNKKIQTKGKVSEKPVQEYIVLKQFVEKIDNVKWIIPIGSTIRLYPDKIGFFPPFKEKKRR